jgi:hypothetical protein
MSYHPTPYPNPFWLQALWVVDPASGNDDNPGTPARPVKTVTGGIIPKWGTPSPQLEQTTTIRFLNDSTEIYAISCALLGEFNLIIETPMTPVGAPFPAGVVTAKNRAAGTQFSVAGMPGGAAANMVVVNTTRGGTRAVIRSVVAGVAELTQPLSNFSPGDTVYFPGGGCPTEDDGWTAGDLLELFQPIQVGFPILSVQCGPSDPAITTSGLWLKGAKVFDPSGTPEDSLFEPIVSGGYINLADCHIEPYVIISDTLATNVVNTTTTGIEGDHMFLIGGHDLGGVICYHGCDIDADYIPEFDIAVSGSDIIVGFLHLPAGTTFFAHPTASIRIHQTLYGTNPVVWGTGTLEAEGGAGVVWNSTGQPWATTVYCGMTLSGLGTGTSYAAGVWTDGIALTAANLDANNGTLQNPRSGARFTAGT